MASQPRAPKVSSTRCCNWPAAETPTTTPRSICSAARCCASAAKPPQAPSCCSWLTKPIANARTEVRSSTVRDSRSSLATTPAETGSMPATSNRASCPPQPPSKQVAAASPASMLLESCSSNAPSLSTASSDCDWQPLRSAMTPPPWTRSRCWHREMAKRRRWTPARRKRLGSCWQRRCTIPYRSPSTRHERPARISRGCSRAPKNNRSDAAAMSAQPKPR